MFRSPTLFVAYRHFSPFRAWAIIQRRSMQNPITITSLGGENIAGPARLRHIRYKNKLDGKLPVPSVIELIVVGTGAGGTPKSLLVRTDYFKYVVQEMLTCAQE